MIVVYPVIVSRAVGENIIPGICKMLENYLVVYSMDDILGNIKSTRKVNYKIRGKKLFESDLSPVVLSEIDPWYLPGNKDPEDMSRDEVEQEKLRIQQAQAQWDEEKAAAKSERDRKEIELKQQDADRRERELDHKIKSDQDRAERDKDKATRDKEKDRKEDEDKKKLKAAGNKAASADVTDMKSVSLEPTFIKVKMADGGTDFIGVKVVPIRVKSEAKLSHLLVNDLSLGFIRGSIIGIGRKIFRWFYLKIGRSKTIDTPTGDPRKDMFYARTGLQGNAFVLLDKNEDIDATLYSNPKMVVKLFGLSWGNMMLADDINRKVYFCMKKFKGMCTMIPYSMIYQTLGQKQVFDDLEDARQKSGALFKRKGVSLQKIASEHHAQFKLDSYQYISEDSKNG